MGASECNNGSGQHQRFQFEQGFQQAQPALQVLDYLPTPPGL
jgi:hypothetical protein